MTASAYADDFVDLSGWTATNMAVASGEVKASADNATIGKLTRTYESQIGGSFARVGFDFVVDTTMTASTQVSIAMLDATSAIGTCVLIKQGVGIQSGYYFNTPNGFGSPTTLLAWELLVNGGRYHIEWTLNPASWFGFVSLYDPSGNLVARAATSQNAVDWYNVTRVVVESNSTKTTLSRFAIDPKLTGSATTGKYFTNVATFTYFLTAANVVVDLTVPGTGVNAVDLYIPGGGNVNELAVYFHGAGQSPNFTEMTTIATLGSLIQAFLKEGVMVVVPKIPDGLGGGDSWGNDFGAASVASAIVFARTAIGNARAPQHYLAYSMGMLTAGRLIGNDGQTNVKSLHCLRGCCDMAHNEQNGFASQIDTAWGVAHQGSYAAAQATFARGNPLGLLNSFPGRFAGVAMFLEYGTTGDGTVPQANNCVAFAAALTAKNIPFKSSVRVFAGHTENSSVGDATAHLAQAIAASSGGGGSAGSGSLSLGL